MKVRRVTLFAGHYGSGKTNIAVNYALYLHRLGYPTTVADLDIVNPYFRTKDSEKELTEAGLHLICSPYANTNVDVPALPQELYAVTDDKSRFAVLDIGGDDRGALALGRYAPAILTENNFEMLLVVNRFRPLTKTAQQVKDIISEIEAAGGIPFTGFVDNSNLGMETCPSDILESKDYSNQIQEKTGLPLLMTTVKEDLYNNLKDRVPNLFPLRLQKKIVDLSQ